MYQGQVFHRHSKPDLPIAAAGEGPFVIDQSGRRYLDGCGGAAVSCLGHGDKEVVAAIKSQLDEMAYAHTSFFSSDAAERLAERLIDRAPQGLGKVYFVSGGSEAVEAALKLARQYFLEIRQPQRRHVIGRWQSYHGNTLGALSAGGNVWRRQQFEPFLIENMYHIPPCYYWRHGEPGEDPTAYGQRMAQALESQILELGEDKVAAFIAEPVVGATLGAVPAVDGYFASIREICNRYGVLLILDEVMCGMGRTGTLFACEREHVCPDMITIAKGLGGGYQPIGATLVSEQIYKAVEFGSGFFQHGHTYLGHPVACAAGNAVLDAIDDRELLTNVVRQGAALGKGLAARFGGHAHVGDIRGRGLFYGMEFVEDRASKRPFDPELRLSARIKQAAMDNGLMIYPGTGSVDGRAGDHILLAPPFIIERHHLDDLFDRLEVALASVFEDIQ